MSKPSTYGLPPRGVQYKYMLGNALLSISGCESVTIAIDNKNLILTCRVEMRDGREVDGIIARIPRQWSELSASVAAHRATTLQALDAMAAEALRHCAPSDPP